MKTSVVTQFSSFLDGADLLRTGKGGGGGAAVYTVLTSGKRRALGNQKHCIRICEYVHQMHLLQQG